MKKIFLCFLLISCILSTGMVFQGNLYAANIPSEISIYLDGQKMILDTKPIMQGNRALVPLRSIFEKLGANVDWNQDTKQAIVKNDAIEVLLEIDNHAVLVNGKVQFLETPSLLKNGKTLVPVRFIAESLGYKVDWQASKHRIDISTKITTTTNDTKKLPTLENATTFAKLLHYNNVLDNYIQKGFIIDGGVIVDGDIPVEEAVGDALPIPDSGSKTEASQAPTVGDINPDHSNTNNQTEGVEEGDIIKTDGKHIFSLIQNNLHILDPNPTHPKIISTLEIPNQRGSVSDLYIEGNKLVVLGNSWVQYGYPTDLIKPFGSSFVPSYGTNNTFVLVYDITDPSKPVLSKDLDFEGRTISSRLISDKLYVITSKSLNYWTIEPLYRNLTDPSNKMIRTNFGADGNIPLQPLGLSDTEFEETIKSLYDYQFKPKYANNLTGKITVMDYNKINYFPDYITPNFMMTVGIDLSSEAVDVKAYLGSAEIVYASTEHLYLTLTKYEYTTKRSSLLFAPSYEKSTTLYKFKLDNGQINYVANGTVPGTALNQFSLDAFNNNLRIATTTGEMWDQNNISKNNIYILNSDLSIIGKLTDLAPGERIYSTRFAGNRIYMLTFRQVDPFFVIDATDPTTPKVLGDLKIPGFSTYMHILDENHVLGFGTDTLEEEGRVTMGGFKISLFDVTNPSVPIEKNKEVIGVAGTYSELQNNHKALMISLDKGIMAFPITVSSKTPYVTDFSGAYVYNVSSDTFSFKGLLSHQTSSTVYGEGEYKYFDYNYNINRILYIGDYLYALSPGKMDVTSLKDMKKTGEVTFPTPKYIYGKPVEVLPLD